MTLADELEALAAKATPGPWAIYEQTIAASTYGRTVDNAKAELALQIDQIPRAEISDILYLIAAGDKCPATTGCGPTSADNAALLTSLVNNLPAIITALRTDTRAEVEREIVAWRTRELQMLGSGLSLRSWHQVEDAYNQLRDKIDRFLNTRGNHRSKTDAG